MSKLYDKYLELKHQNQEKMYLFKSGKFYIFIGDDCETINNYIPLKKTKFTNYADKCGFPIDVLDNYLKVFNNLNLDVEVINEEINVNIDKIINFIRTININNITPVEALNKLEKLKEMVDYFGKEC